MKNLKIQLRSGSNLCQKNLSTLLKNLEYEKICNLALESLNKAYLADRFELMALSNGLKEDEARKKFAAALYDLLYGEREIKERFESFAATLNFIGAPKWPLISYFLFLMYPDKYMFVKPTVSKNAAEICHFEINYKPDLNWTTYESILKFAEYLKRELKKCGNDYLNPRDMIDVQSFMWCIRPGTYD